MHPYLARREGSEKINYYDPQLEPVLERTLGVPLFQEQMLKMAMVIADFTGDEAEELRRALSFHRSHERMKRVEGKLRDAMKAKGVSEITREEIVKAIKSFALYGFPESHAISFANLTYASAYLKVHRAAEFYASLLNNQPMGFYSSASLVQDARRHGLTMLPVCVSTSDWRCQIIDDRTIRLGFCVVNGFNEAAVQRLIEERKKRAFETTHDFAARTRLSSEARRTLAALGALNALANHRRQALWEIEGAGENDLLTPVQPRSATPLRAMSHPERIQADYDGMSLTTGRHPMHWLRPQIPGLWPAADLPLAENGSRVWIGGNVICRQRPGTAKGVVFISLEDETGVANAVVYPKLFESDRLVITQESALKIYGRLQIHKGTIHLLAEKIEPLLAGEIPHTESYDFH